MYPQLPSPLASFRRILLIASACLGLATSGQAQLILFDFANQNTESSATLTNATYTQIAAGAGIVSTGFSTTVGSPQPSWIITNQTTTGGPGNLGASVTANDYVEFTITPDAGYVLNLTEFRLHLRGAPSGSSTSWTGFGVRYDLDYDPGTPEFVTLLNQTSGVPDGSPNPLAEFIIPLTDTDISGTVSFRIYFMNGGRGVIDNVQLSGSLTAVPEPTAFTALLIGSLGLILIRRRR